jgi:hypothetical protein
MTSLQRTDLPTSQQVELAAQALARQAHGAITALTHVCHFWGPMRPKTLLFRVTARSGS